MNLSKKIFSDPVNKWAFNKVRTGIFLVGGYLRDLLLGRASKDIDFVLANNVEKTATQLANRFNGTFMLLKKSLTYRVVLKNKQFIDLTPLSGSIYDNLKERDFTVNAMAWSPETDIVDPFGGLNDLKKRQIKTVAPENLAMDSLRVLRAYRHAAELSFSIEKDTTRYLKLYATDLTRAAPERITDELFKILNTRGRGNYLRACYNDGVLERVIRLNKKRLKENIKLLTSFDTMIGELKNKKTYLIRNTARYLQEEISQGLTREGLIRLALLITDGKGIISRDRPLRLSRMINKSLAGVLKGCELSKGKISDKRLYEIFKAADKNVLEMALILSLIKRRKDELFLDRAYEFIKTKRRRLLTGREIQNILNITPGVIIGKVLSILHEVQFHGMVKTKSDAKAWVLSNFT